MFSLCRASVARFVGQTANKFVLPKSFPGIQNYSSLLMATPAFRHPVRKLDLEAGKLTDLVVSRAYRNGRLPKKSNHGKRPCCHTRRRAKKKMIKSRGYREKLFGFW
jgi:hypothetical protein